MTDDPVWVWSWVNDNGRLIVEASPKELRGPLHSGTNLIEIPFYDNKWDVNG